MLFFSGLVLFFVFCLCVIDMTNCNGEGCLIKERCFRYVNSEIEKKPFTPTLCEDLDYDFIPLVEIELEAV